VDFTALRDENPAAEGFGCRLNRARVVGIMKAMDDQRELTEDQANDQSGWDADDEYEWVR
jgi:hypothetical protein